MRRKHSKENQVELNITAFLNLMVVLIPFLLLNAVFAQVSVLQLSLPSPDTAPPEEQPEQPPLVLEIMIYGNRYEVADRNTGPIKIILNKTEEHDYEELHELLLDLKKRVPDILSATILCEDDTPYELLISTMDYVRITTKTDSNGNTTKYELFPEISIGSAPKDTTKTAGAAS